MERNPYFIEEDPDTIIDRLSLLPEQRKRYRLIVTSPPYYKHRKYGDDVRELGRESSDCAFVDRLIMLFAKCRRLLRDDGSLWIVIGDSRRNYGKLLIPHSLTSGLVKEGYILREDIIWYKRNYIASGSQINFSQAYEYVLFFSKRANCFTNMDMIRFAVCNLRGKNPGNVWDIATKAHHGNEHFAIFPEELVERIVKFATQKGDWVMDPFSGRGTTGIICKKLKRRFVGIDLYPNNILLSKRNVQNASPYD